VPHAHTILVAAIFGLYVGSMGGLIAYACSTGSYPDSAGRDDSSEDEEPELPIAA
jgi:hypothetical protein